jgi:hypothetical protein
MKSASLRFAAITTLALLLSGAGTIVMAKTSLVYIASQNPDQKGIATAEINPATGELSAPKMSMETPDPSQFALSTGGTH